MRDPAGTGRIYRITPKGRRLSTPALDLATTAGQLQALQSPALHVRPLGFERLKEQGDEAVAAVHGLLASGNPYHRARAVWLLAQLGPAGQAVVEDLLDGPDDTLRATAFRALRQVTDDVLPYARRLARDPAPAVRREVALALRDVPPAARRDLIVPLAEGYDGSDPWYLEALGAACDGLEAACYTLLRDRLGGDPAAWDARFAGLAWRLHPPNAVADLQRRAGSARVPEAERRRALTALGFVAAPEAAQAMADLTRSDLPDIAAQAGWWMQYRTGNAWHAYAVTGWAPPVAAPQAGRDLAPLLAALNDPEASIDRRVDAAAALAADPVGGLHLIGLAAQQQLSYQVRQGAGPTLFRNPERTVRVLARGYFSPPGEAPARDAEAIAGLPADAARGRMLFASACAACHRVGTLGGDVGPALTAVRNKLDERGLLDALLHPGAAVAHGYAPVLVTTRDGDASAGILLADGEAVVLRDAYGRQHQVAADRVAARHPLQASLMPGPDELHLTDQDLADLTAFLLTLPP
jgi:putative heme-binding domain-containing protein